MKLTRTKTILIQGILGMLQALNLKASELFPAYGSWAVLITIVLVSATTTFAALAHDFEPDGTKTVTSVPADEVNTLKPDASPSTVVKVSTAKFKIQNGDK